MGSISDIRDILNTRDCYDIMNEKYLSYKSKDIDDIEKLFDELRYAYPNNTEAVDPKIVKSISNFQKLKKENYRKISEITKRHFNFRDVGIITASSATNIGSWVAVDPVKIVTIPKYIHDDKGYRFKEPIYEVIINIPQNFYKKLTPREITAVYLHEIGHNFSPAAFERLAIFLPWYYVGLLMASLLKTAKIKISNSDINILKPIRYYSEELFESIDKIYGEFSNIFGGTTNVIGVPKGKLQYDIMESILNFFGTKDEVNSDIFAGSYGYSVELSSALIKLSDSFVKDMIESGNPLMNTMYFVTGWYGEVVHILLKPYPTDLNRGVVLKKFLEEALKDETDPLVIKTIKSEINRIDEVNAILKKKDKNVALREFLNVFKIKEISDKDITDIRVKIEADRLGKDFYNIAEHKK